MTSKHRRALIDALTHLGTMALVNLQALSDAMKFAGLAVCRIGYVADLKEAAADYYTGMEHGIWPAAGRDATKRRFVSLMNNGRVDDGS